MFFPGVLEQLYIATGATDMRKSINGLSIMVADQLAFNPLSGHLFCCCNRKRDIIKILYWDRNGFCLWHKRLEKERFHWPENEADVIEMGCKSRPLENTTNLEKVRDILLSLSFPRSSVGMHSGRSASVRTVPTQSMGTRECGA